MDLKGLALCSRYSYPPNSLSLCGPDKKKDLNWYTVTQKTDKGTLEILSQFFTLYPYLTLIASVNKINDPFDKKVVEAYWIGNKLLHQIPATSFVGHLSDKIRLKEKIKRPDLYRIFDKITEGALPHHSFHVLNIYKRTGHLGILHTLETMDACLINFGKVIKMSSSSIMVETKPLRLKNNHLMFDQNMNRTIMTQGEKDILFKQLKIGDWISYHWGYFCQKLTNEQLQNLVYYTNLSVKYANIYQSSSGRIGENI